MNREQLVEWRRGRLAFLVEEMGGPSAVGRAIGHTSGEQVSHMISGRRVISEKTMDAIHALPGRAGWFDKGLFPTDRRPLSILEFLRDQQAFLAELSDADRVTAKYALHHLIDHAEKLDEVVRLLASMPRN